MLCLHGKPAASSTTENGSFWFCGQHPKCHFICPEDEGYLYDKAIQAFLATKQERPKCCASENSEERNFAKIRVVKDLLKASFGRPFFTCSKRDERCEYFEWGDEIIIPKPLCKHGKPCKLRRVKKEGSNQGRTFLCCPERIEESCRFFKWIEVPKTHTHDVSENTETPNPDVVGVNTKTPQNSEEDNEMAPREVYYRPGYFTEFVNTARVKRKRHK